MTLDYLKTKEKLRDLIDAYAYLSDDKKIDEVMELFVKDGTYSVYMHGALVANTTGTATLAQEFKTHASLVKTYFTMNGQHTVKIEEKKANGISFAEIKMIREVDGKDHMTDYSVRYDDEYMLENEKWLIKNRTAYFIIVEARSLNH